MHRLRVPQSVWFEETRPAKQPTKKWFFGQFGEMFYYKTDPAQGSAQFFDNGLYRKYYTTTQLLWTVTAAINNAMVATGFQ